MQRSSRGEDVEQRDDVDVVVPAGEEGQVPVGPQHVLLHHVGALVDLIRYLWTATVIVSGWSLLEL